MKKTIKIVLAVLAVIVVLLLVLAALVISAPKSYPYTVADAEADAMTAAEIVDMISDAVVDDEGNIPEIAVVTIPPENVNALLRIAAYRLNREIRDSGIECSFGWDDSAVRAEASIPLPLSLAVVARGSASPVIADGVLTVPSLSLRAGHLPVPNFGFVKDRITADDIKDEKTKLAFEAIHDLSASQDGSLQIGVYPEKISALTRLLLIEEE
ncbi:MAG: hypothetical protein IKQ16_03785 [Lentisphaeria bacterium]|nr:hypothetical protein [Lentisphaeria bacterium]